MSTLSDAIGRESDHTRSPRAVRLLAGTVFRDIPPRLRDPEGIAHLGMLGGAILAFGIVTTLGIAAALVAAGLPQLAAVAAAIVSATLLTRMQRRRLQAALTPGSHPVAAGASRLSSLLIVGAAAFLVTSIALLAPLPAPADTSLLLRGLAIAAGILAVVLALSGESAATAGRARSLASTRERLRPPSRFPPRRYAVVPSVSRPGSEGAALGRRLAFDLAVIGGMTPASTRRRARLWTPFTMPGALVVASGMLGALCVLGFSLRAVGAAPWLAYPAASAWGVAAVLVGSHALQLRRFAFGHRWARVLAGIAAAAQCLIAGAVTGLSAIGALGLVDLDSVSEGDLPALTIATFVVCASVAVLPLFPAPAQAGRSALYDLHVRLTERARAESEPTP